MPLYILHLEGVWNKETKDIGSKWILQEVFFIDCKYYIIFLDLLKPTSSDISIYIHSD